MYARRGWDVARVCVHVGGGTGEQRLAHTYPRPARAQELSLPAFSPALTHAKMPAFFPAISPALFPAMLPAMLPAPSHTGLPSRRARESRLR